MKPFVVLEPFLRRRPRGWQVHSLRRVARLVEDQNQRSDAPLLSLTIAGGLSSRAADVQPPAAEYLRKYGMVKPGDLVVNPMWLSGGSIGVSDNTGAVSPEYRIYRFGTEIFPRFAHHLVRSDPYMHQYRLLVRAETTFDRRVTKDDFRALPILVPSLAEQRTIAAFLDRETTRIDALITEKQRMTALLEERRRRSWATTLEEMEDGSHPRVPLGYCVSEVRTKNFAGRETNRLSLSYGNIVRRDIESSDGLLPESFDTYCVVEEGDVVLRLTDLQNDQRSLRVGLVKERGIITSAYISIRPNHGLNPSFLALVLRGMDARKEFYALGAGIRQSLKFDELQRIRIPILRVDEQDQLVSRDTHRSTVGSDVTRNLELQIELLREHRQALISAAVTGELDISGEAA